MNDLWLLAPSVFALMAEVRARPFDPPTVAAWGVKREAEAASRSNGGLPENLTLAGSVAEIRVEGVLTKRPDFWAWLLGGGNTTYTSIRQALAVAEQDPKIKTIVLAIDSPGGSVDGLFETLDAIASMRGNSSKALRVRADNAQSAAYGIAAVAGSIEAASRVSTFGSIGVAQSFRVAPDVVTLTNTDSPDKRPDVSTAEGKAVVVKYLDQISDEFVRAIAKGRDVTPSTVASDYGRGQSFTAPNALKLGLIDKISTPPRAVNSKGKAMAEPQDARASAAEIDAAVQRGVTQERDRVLGHIIRGEAVGAMPIALEAIRSGAAMTQELDARYFAAGLNRADSGRRQTESSTVATVVAGAGAPPASAPDLTDQVAALVGAEERSFVRG